jgi:hypothetical protein
MTQCSKEIPAQTMGRNLGDFFLTGTTWLTRLERAWKIKLTIPWIYCRKDRGLSYHQKADSITFK